MYERSPSPPPFELFPKMLPKNLHFRCSSFRFPSSSRRAVSAFQPLFLYMRATSFALSSVFLLPSAPPSYPFPSSSLVIALDPLQDRLFSPRVLFGSVPQMSSSRSQPGAQLVVAPFRDVPTQVWRLQLSRLLLLFFFFVYAPFRGPPHARQCKSSHIAPYSRSSTVSFPPLFRPLRCTLAFHT